MIEVQGLRKYFGSVAAVRDVSFAALDGRITGLLGANGAGKSTTLRILSTLLEPDAGGGRIDNLELRGDPLGVRRLIGVLPHSSGVYPNLTGRENISYFGRLQGLDVATIDRRARELVELLEMGDFVDRRTKDTPKANGSRSRSRVRSSTRRATWCLTSPPMDST
jgi:sodium transport system ATP-binding protein